MGSIAYVDSLALFKQLPAQLTLISISTEFVLRCTFHLRNTTGHLTHACLSASPAVQISWTELLC